MNQHDNSDWKRIDETLRRLARDKGKYDFEEGRWLLAGLRSGVHLRLGFATFAEYVERLFGYKPRFTAERLRVAEALQDLPVTSAALEGGDVCWSAVREVSRVATPEVIEMAECDAQQIGRTHVGHEVAEMAECDAQQISRTHVGEKHRATQDIPPATRRHVVRREHGQCAVPVLALPRHPPPAAAGRRRRARPIQPHPLMCRSPRGHPPRLPDHRGPGPRPPSLPPRRRNRLRGAAGAGAGAATGAGAGAGAGAKRV